MCMKANVDPELLKLVQQHVDTLTTDVKQMTFEVQEDRKLVLQKLMASTIWQKELEGKVESVQRALEVVKQDHSLLLKTVDALQSTVDTRVVSEQHEQKFVKEEQSSLLKKGKVKGNVYLENRYG